MFLVLALSRPVQESVLQKANIESKNIIIALDVSFSMKATDLSPTRYDFAKKTIASFLQNNLEDNVMLIVFTTNPLLLSPPTTDHRLINVALESLNPEFILTKGTSLVTLFKKLDSMQMGKRQLVLITDGGEEKELVNLTNTLQKTQLILTVIALGTNTGTTVSNADGSYLKDKEGNLVISRLNPLLESLSSAVNGTYLTPSSTPKSTADKLSGALQSQKTQKVKKIQRHYLELYQVPLAVALLLFLLVHTRAVKYLVVLFGIFGFQAQASFQDDYYLNLAYKSYVKQDFNATVKKLKQIQVTSLQSQMTLASTHYKQNDFKKSIQIYKSIRSTSVKVKQQLYYNIANAYAMQKAYHNAKIYYTKTLQLGVDEDASHNLELVVLLADKKDAQLGIAHPKSQDAGSSKSESQDKEESRNEDKPSNGSGASGESTSPKEKAEEKNKLLDDEDEEKYPLSSKVYELINKGYIHETRPW
jgi:Ca-activated chloride channel family protein